MLILDEGPEKENLELLIRNEKMENHIFLLGFKKDFIQYMAASHLLIQPSLSDASNGVAKEMGMLEKMIAVTDGVGDYSEYITNEQNGFLIRPNEISTDIETIIRLVYSQPDKFSSLGKNLKSTVLDRFDIRGAN